MDLREYVKRFAPESMLPFLRAGYRFARARIPKSRSALYRDRLRDELASYRVCQNVQDLPPIAHYWSHRFLVPMLTPLGFTNALELVRSHILRVCREHPDGTCFAASLGSGEGQAETNLALWLLEQDCRNFQIECLDANPEALDRGQAIAQESNVATHLRFDTFDINSWSPRRCYPIIMAFQSLHHVVELERLFETIRRALEPGGRFLADDMIGRNGHQRWPEALSIVQELWKDLPERYKYNHQLGRIVDPFENFDHSKTGFEGIRAQDVLPLLVKTFHFETFAAFGNLIDIFIDRGFGHNFDPEDPEDTAFIDKVHALDTVYLESGRLKPTHMLAAMTVDKMGPTAVCSHLTPEFCIRRP